jgi:hypothetical protein
MSEPIITHADGQDRRHKMCRCSKCEKVVLCTPSFDFYGRNGAPLVCEACFHREVHENYPRAIMSRFDGDKLTPWEPGKP